MEIFYQDCLEKRTRWKGSDVSQTPELRLSGSSTGRVRQGERGAVLQHQGTAVLQGVCVCTWKRAMLCSQRTAQFYAYKNSRETIDKDHF